MSKLTLCSTRVNPLSVESAVLCGKMLTFAGQSLQDNGAPNAATTSIRPRAPNGFRILWTLNEQRSKVRFIPVCPSSVEILSVHVCRCCCCWRWPSTGWCTKVMFQSTPGTTHADENKGYNRLLLTAADRWEPSYQCC